MYENYSQRNEEEQIYVFLMVDPKVEEEIKSNFISMLGCGYDVEFVEFDGTESLNELTMLYPFHLAVIDADLFVPIGRSTKNGYEVAWALLQLDEEVRIMLMDDFVLEKNKESISLKDNTVVYKKAEGRAISSLGSFRKEIAELLKSRKIFEKLSNSCY